VCAMCVSVTALASATNASKAKVSTESTRRREQNVGIELKILDSKVMTVMSLPRNLHLALTAGNWHLMHCMGEVCTSVLFMESISNKTAT